MNRSRKTAFNLAACALIMSAPAIQAAEETNVNAPTPLDTLQLPPVEKKPWRFQGFPIIGWWGPPGTATVQDFQNYQDAGFNIYAANPDTTYEQAMDKAVSVGLKIMPFRHAQGFNLQPKPTDYARHRNSIVGWITNDEPSGYEGVIQSITAVNTLMREDASRWTLFNMLPPGAQHNPSSVPIMDAAVRHGMPVLSYDSYHLIRDGNTSETPFYQNLALFRQGSLRNNVPFWAFALSIEHGHYRESSESDMRWTQFSSLAYGAKGLWYFTYWAPPGERNWENKAVWGDFTKKALVVGKDGTKTPLYSYAQKINLAVRDMGALLLRLKSRAVVHTKAPEGVAAFAPNTQWIADVDNPHALIGFFEEENGKRYAMLVNTRHGMNLSAAATAETFNLKFADTVKKVTAVNWLDGQVGPLQMTNGSATLRIAGGTGVLLRLDS